MHAFIVPCDKPFLSLVIGVPCGKPFVCNLLCPVTSLLFLIVFVVPWAKPFIIIIELPQSLPCLAADSQAAASPSFSCQASSRPSSYCRAPCSAAWAPPAPSPLPTRLRLRRPRAVPCSSSSCSPPTGWLPMSWTPRMTRCYGLPQPSAALAGVLLWSSRGIMGYGCLAYLASSPSWPAYLSSLFTTVVLTRQAGGGGGPALPNMYEVI